MNEIILSSFSLTTIQISSSYLRYLPFSHELSPKKVLKLRKYILIWGLASLAINYWIFSDGMNYQAYKIATFPGWIPYFLISLRIICNRLFQHIFILGMQCLWTFMLHAFAGMCVTLIFGAMSEEFLHLQLIFYLILFAILFRIERKFFINLLPTQKFFEDKTLRLFISMFPFAIFIGTLISISDVTFFQHGGENYRVGFSQYFFSWYIIQ